MYRSQEEIEKYIFDNVEFNSTNITAMLVGRFGFSRQTAHKYISREVEKGNLIKVGSGAGTRYFLPGGKHIAFSIDLERDKTEESVVFKTYIKPMISELNENSKKILNFVFTEILNNSIDHSGGTEAYIELVKDSDNIRITILDNGVGIFKKIQEALNLDSMRESILHLSKGKFTTDPENHSGEGIFFSSRALDSFSIFSSDLYYSFKKNDWILSDEKPEEFGRGTSINMVLSKKTDKNLKDLFKKYTDDDHGFDKTIVAVSLSTDPGDFHVSRSQAKRLLIGLDKFKHIVLDFKGIESVGQAFVDEVFRVFSKDNPGIKIDHINAEGEVKDMILRGIARRNEES